MILALNCYQHCLESRYFDKASYFEAYVEKIIGKGIKLFEVLELPEQVAYYQEHFDKFVKV